jgi:hypothetical protein
MDLPMPAHTSSVSLSPSDRLNTEAAAKFLGLSPNTLAAWRCRKKGPPCYRFGGKVVTYEVADLQSFLAHHKVQFEQVPL